MCRVAHWKNVCGCCEKKEKLRRVEHGWCPEALHRRRFGGCGGGVEERDIQYAGKLRNLGGRPGLAATPKKYPYVQYFR